MTTPTVNAGLNGAASVEDRLDRLGEQLAQITEQLQAMRAERAMWQEFSHELPPIAQGAMTVMSRELEDLSQDVTLDDVTRFARNAVRSAPDLDALLGQLHGLNELLSELTSLTGAMMAKASDMLATADSRGYFTFARGGAAIADRVVTSFDEKDIAALGDNVVLILNTVKEMTQPEVMTMLQRTAVTMQDVDHPAAPPSLFGLLKQMRDPQVRLGLGRAMTMLRSLGAQESPLTDATKE